MKRRRKFLTNYSFKKVINETAVMSEILLCARYLKIKGIKLDWTLEHWWYCLSKYFGIIDITALTSYGTNMIGILSKDS